MILNNLQFTRVSQHDLGVAVRKHLLRAYCVSDT